VFLCIKKPEYAWICAFVPAGGSFWAQSLYGVCPTCVGAASVFALAGIVSLSRQRMTVPAFAGLVFLISGLIAFQHNLPDQRNLVLQTKEIKASEIKASQPIKSELKETVSEKQTKLYFSPLCPRCHEVVRLFVAHDPEGKTWTPVICPTVARYGGIAMLTSAGYKGTYSVADSSPTRSYPCLEANGRYYVGDKTIKEVLAQIGTD